MEGSGCISQLSAHSFDITITMVLSLVKLGTLALQTASKPFANRLKKEARLHPKFRHLIVNIAQVNRRFTTQMQRRIYCHSTDVAIRPLNEEKAVETIADLVGAFTVAGAVVVFEVQRSAKSEARKEETRRQEVEAVRQQNKNLAEEVELLKRRAQDLEQQSKGRGLGAIFSREGSKLPAS